VLILLIQPKGLHAGPSLAAVRSRQNIDLAVKKAGVVVDAVLVTLELAPCRQRQPSHRHEPEQGTVRTG
jgi:hypothetical protein